MCGINGFNFEDKRIIQRMVNTTSHRGPDGSSVIAEEGISLGHNRLAIIDLDTRSAQPMENGDGTLIIVFNGEIYNYRELKAELSDYPFRTESDTEVILAAYQTWGRTAVEKFNGIFAFAIWDRTKQELFLARDQMGVKPLYYFADGERFIFSSEIKAILEHAIPRRLNIDAFEAYLRLLYTPEPHTMFEGIFAFPPAHRGVVKKGVLRTEEYWHIDPLRKNTESPLEIHEHIRQLVDAGVERQLISDRPLGLFLSGGIDSSIVLDSMSRVRGNIATYSVGFDLTEKEQSEKFNADFLLARKTAEAYGTKHHEIRMNADEVVSLLEKSVYHLDTPIANATALAQMALSTFASESVVVALGGDGGDELFGGYERYRLAYLSGLYRHVPHPLREVFNRVSPSLKKLDTLPGVERFRQFHFQKDATLSSVIAPAYVSNHTEALFAPYFAGATDATFLDIFMDVDRQSWLVDESLLRSDKMSMASGVELRVPLLDRDLVTYAATIPSTHKVSLRNTKVIFKEAFRDRLPAYLFAEPKRGWFSPGAKWLRRESVSRFADTVLSPTYYPEMAPLFQFEGITQMLDSHRSGKAYNLTMLWALIVFQVWAKRFKVQLGR